MQYTYVEDNDDEITITESEKKDVIALTEIESGTATSDKKE